MRDYKDLRDSLAANPRTWTLAPDAPLDGSLPVFPATKLNLQTDDGSRTSRRKLRSILLKQPPTDPALLANAVQRRIITADEATNVMRNFWGEEISWQEDP